MGFKRIPECRTVKKRGRAQINPAARCAEKRRRSRVGGEDEEKERGGKAPGKREAGGRAAKTAICHKNSLMDEDSSGYPKQEAVQSRAMHARGLGINIDIKCHHPPGLPSYGVCR